MTHAEKDTHYYLHWDRWTMTLRSTSHHYTLFLLVEDRFFICENNGLVPHECPGTLCYREATCQCDV
ncbi:hypothetical protein Avbf_14254 [Armadillidium vulgare]|nr:hypothetical protein Avbf_14254 [Armadillidium vulgare]